MSTIATLQELKDRRAYYTEQPEILCIDMDGVIADFAAGVRMLNHTLNTHDYGQYEAVKATCIANPRVFLNLPVIQGAKEAIATLKDMYDIQFLSTPMHYVHESFSDKRTWLFRHFGPWADERLNLTHRKDLFIGDYLVDDTTRNGVDRFKGRHIHFGTDKFPGWDSVVEYLTKNRHHKII